MLIDSSLMVVDNKCSRIRHKKQYFEWNLLRKSKLHLTEIITLSNKETCSQLL